MVSATTFRWARMDRLLQELHHVSVHSAPAFDAQPTSSDVHNRLSITFVALFSHRSVCDVDEAISDCGSYIIFEVEGSFDGNWKPEAGLWA